MTGYFYPVRNGQKVPKIGTDGYWRFESNFRKNKYQSRVKKEIFESAIFNINHLNIKKEQPEIVIAELKDYVKQFEGLSVGYFENDKLVDIRENIDIEELKTELLRVAFASPFFAVNSLFEFFIKQVISTRKYKLKPDKIFKLYNIHGTFIDVKKEISIKIPGVKVKNHIKKTSSYFTDGIGIGYLTEVIFIFESEEDEMAFRMFSSFDIENEFGASAKELASRLVGFSRMFDNKVQNLISP